MGDVVLLHVSGGCMKLLKIVAWLMFYLVLFFMYAILGELMELGRSVPSFSSMCISMSVGIHWYIHQRGKR